MDGALKVLKEKIKLLEAVKCETLAGTIGKSYREAQKITFSIQTHGVKSQTME